MVDGDSGETPSQPSTQQDQKSGYSLTTIRIIVCVNVELFLPPLFYGIPADLSEVVP